MCDYPECVMGSDPHEQFTYWYEDGRDEDRTERFSFWTELRLRYHGDSDLPFQDWMERAYQQGVADGRGAMTDSPVGKRVRYRDEGTGTVIRYVPQYDLNIVRFDEGPRCGDVAEYWTFQLEVVDGV